MLRRQQYRIYFRDNLGRIEACENFLAKDDASALTIALLLFNACSDFCCAYELWLDQKRLDTQDAGFAAQITPEMRFSLVGAAEGLLRTKWKIAQSGRLMDYVRRWREAEREEEGWADISLALP